MPSSQTSVQSSSDAHSRRRHAGIQPMSFLGPGDRMGEGDTQLVFDILPPDLAETAFENLRKEIKWNVMHHRGGEVPRLVAVQGEIAPDGSYPIYRHPADSSPPLLPFSPTVSLIRAAAEKHLNHPVNHVLIQHYRSGADYISEHSDKTIDVVQGSNIINVSLGAERIMVLRTKKDSISKVAKNLNREVGVGADHDDTGSTSITGSDSPHTQRIPLPHNSMLVMGLLTNAKWMHSIRTDKRPFKTKSPAEQFNNGERISLTFRHIGTFLTPPDETGKQKIWGQGAKGKRREDAGEVVCGGEEAAELIDAFGMENHQSEFVWEKVYGQGSDVLHFKSEDQGV
ncbi:unnamed protein product [Somion occarium]|uniref:Fe2OG dioxygenase domain-containing protein n=1 Tax=Somion occarium TaxID=3059160 RepID=A0ABP1D4Y2_9APHY